MNQLQETAWIKVYFILVQTAGVFNKFMQVGGDGWFADEMTSKSIHSTGEMTKGTITSRLLLVREDQGFYRHWIICLPVASKETSETQMKLSRSKFPALEDQTNKHLKSKLALNR